MSQNLVDLDFFTDPSLLADPYPYYDQLREQPVRREPRHGVVMVSGYEEAVAVYREDRETFSACNVVSGPFPGLPVEAEGDDISELIERYGPTLPVGEYFAAFDPPKHTAHRSLLAGLLTPRRLKENEAYLWKLADQQLDSFFGAGRCELLADFGNPFTMLAIADLLGIPESDRARLRRAPELVGDIEGSEGQHIGVEDEWFAEYVEERRRNPQDDVLTRLAEAKFPDGSTPEPMDVARVATFLFAAGQGTTIDLLSAAFWLLAERPDLQERLRRDAALIPPFVEELLRFESPIKTSFRLARRSTRVGDLEVPAGTHVLIMVGAANRDPRHFEAPNEFRLERPNANENIAFGRGIHACPGAPLARAEARVALERMLARMDEIRLSEAEHGPPGDRRLDWEPTFLLRRIKALNLEFQPLG